MLRGTQYYDRWRFDYRLYREILSSARRHRIPVIALSANATDNQVADGNKAGFDKYITKPFSPKLLLEMVKEVLGDPRS